MHVYEKHSRISEIHVLHVLGPEITEITEIPRPSVACLPGSPVAGLCTEEAVMTTRAVGANCSSILGIFANHQTEAICERQ